MTSNGNSGKLISWLLAGGFSTLLGVSALGYKEAQTHAERLIAVEIRQADCQRRLENIEVKLEQLLSRQRGPIVEPHK